MPRSKYSRRMWQLDVSRLPSYKHPAASKQGSEQDQRGRGRLGLAEAGAAGAGDNRERKCAENYTE